MARLPPRRIAPGPRRVSVARAVVDYAVEHRWQDDVRALVADAVRRGLCDVDELADEVRIGPMRGSAYVRLAVAEVSRGAWSAPEAAAATSLIRAGVPAFEQNVRIALPGGGYFVADFLWRRLRAILEIDSVAHHFAPADLDATMRRHLLLETMGYSVIHRSPASIRQAPEQFVRDVASWLASREGDRPPARDHAV